MCHDWLEQKQIAMALMSLRRLALAWIDSLDMDNIHTWDIRKSHMRLSLATLS